jgi:DNA gyrase subunit B
LYRVKHKGKILYFLNDAELESYRSATNGTLQASRFKGLSEMDPSELWDTTLDPQRRTLLRVTMEDAALAEVIFSTLMGEDVEARKGFIQRNSKDVRFLDI